VHAHTYIHIHIHARIPNDPDMPGTCGLVALVLPLNFGGAGEAAEAVLFLKKSLMVGGLRNARACCVYAYVCMCVRVRLCLYAGKCVCVFVRM
jgi:hypothetical protein